MSELLFENTFLLTVLVTAALLILIGVWSRTRSRRSVNMVLIAVCVSAGLFVLQSVVETPQEKLRRTVRELSEQVEQGDIAAIMEFIAPRPDFAGGRSRDEFEMHLEDLLNRYTVKDPSLSGFIYDLEGDRATITVRSGCTVQTLEWTYYVPSKWELRFELIDGEWLITDIRPLEIAGQQYTSFWTIH